MGWKECSVEGQRQELVAMAACEGVNVSELCRRFGISRKTAYKWIGRSAHGESMHDRSRRPRSSPHRTPVAMEEAVLAVRDEHPTWGARKIYHVLLHEGRQDVPAISTVCAILHRHGRIDERESLKHVPWQRFEHARPNDLWQMDFKGHFPLGDGSRCHPLTVLDDHSRFNLGLRACVDQTTATVQRELTMLFEKYGLPWRMLMDNGSPWGCDREHIYTPLTVWLIRLGIRVSHGRPYHPQTQGKDERFHRTLTAELLRDRLFADHDDSQRRFDSWREIYNHKRPHEALGMAVPMMRYEPSMRAMPRGLSTIEYAAGDVVRKVQQGGWISYKGRQLKVPKAFAGHPIALRATELDGQMAIYFCGERIGTVDLSTSTPQASLVATLPEPPAGMV